MSTPELIMLCGIPCSGKSTWVLVGQTEGPDFPDDFTLLSTDSYIEKVAERCNSTYTEMFDECIKEAQRQLELDLIEAKDKGKHIVWDQTNLTPKARKKKLSKIPSHYRRFAVWFDVDLDVALERNRKRTGKVIPQRVMIQMHSQFVPPTVEEGFDYIIKATP